LRLTKENAKLAIIAKLQKEKDDGKKRVDAQFYEDLTNEARRDAYKRRSCSESRKSKNQTGQRDDEKSSFYIC
jgi:hypothetical protein